MEWLSIILLCGVGMAMLGDRDESRNTSRDNLFRGETEYVPTGDDLRKSRYDNWERQEYDRLMRTDSDFNYYIKKHLRNGYDIEEAIEKVCKDQNKSL